VLIIKKLISSLKLFAKKGNSGNTIYAKKYTVAAGVDHLAASAKLIRVSKIKPVAKDIKDEIIIGTPK